MIQLNYRDSKPICEQIKDGLRRLVLSGSIQAHEQIPTVREFAAGLAINPNTIRRAYRELEEEGYLYTVTGKGIFAADCRGVQDMREKKLLEEFDEVVEELLYLSVNKTTLVKRMEGLTEGAKKA